LREEGNTAITPSPSSRSLRINLRRRRSANEETGTMEFFQIILRHSTSATIVLCQQLAMGMAYAAVTQEPRIYRLN
jgi:hypothetical protein